MKSWNVVMDLFFAFLLLGCLGFARAQDIINVGGASSRCLSAPPETSRCRAAKLVYYFNKSTGRCDQTMYGGCPGSETVETRDQINLFMDLEECKTLCEESSVPCPEQLCMMECAHGFQLSKNGCKLCQCKDAAQPPELGACPLLACPDPCLNGYELEKQSGCPTCTCKKSPSLSACPLMACVETCANGYVADSKGCETCTCQDAPAQSQQSIPSLAPCPAIECPDRCPRGYRLDLNGCQTCHCIEPSPFCPIKMAMCAKYCEYGFMLDKDGCPRCACAGKPVECSPALCLISCEHGLKKNMHGCEVCQCADQPEEPECSPVACNMYCPGNGFRKDGKGCPVCECVEDPCELAACQEDEICVKVKSNPRDYARCEKIQNVHIRTQFSFTLTVIAVIICCCLTSVVTAIIIIACTKRRQKRQSHAIYKPIDANVQM